MGRGIQSPASTQPHSQTPPTHTHNTNSSILNTRFSRFQLKRDNSSVTYETTDGRTDKACVSGTLKIRKERKTRYSVAFFFVSLHFHKASLLPLYWYWVKDLPCNFQLIDPNQFTYLLGKHVLGSDLEPELLLL